MYGDGDGDGEVIAVVMVIVIVMPSRPSCQTGPSLIRKFSPPVFPLQSVSCIRGECIGGLYRAFGGSRGQDTRF